MKLKWLGAAHTLRVWLISGHIISFILWKVGWRDSLRIAAKHGWLWFWYLLGCEYSGREGGRQLDFWFGPFRIEWWTHTGSEEGLRHWGWVCKQI